MIDNDFDSQHSNPRDGENVSFNATMAADWLIATDAEVPTHKDTIPQRLSNIFLPSKLKPV